MEVTEMRSVLEAIARDESQSASSRCRAIEVLLRIAKTTTDEQAEWDALVEDLRRD